MACVALSGENSRANHQNVLEDSCGRSNGRHQLPSFLAKEWQKITYDRKVSQPFSRQTGVSFDEACARTVAALKQEGFGVLTEIDVKSTLKSKLDREFRRYVILGACNPQLAHRALEAELGMGLLLPCNVCVWEEDGGSVVSIARPEAMFQIVNREDVQPVAQEADERLRRVLDKISTGA
jgi:uncharacterized protein (DUF302 family)